MAGNQVTLTLAGDSKSLERTFANVGQSATKMAGDMDKASGTAKGLDKAMGTVSNTVDSSESKFMGTADVLDGLTSVMGINASAQIEMARGFGDIAGGLTNLGPLFSGIAGKLGLTTAAQWAMNTASTAFNAVMAMNPIGLVVIALAALVAAFVIAYKNSETFRNVVHGAMRGAADAVGWVVDRFQGMIGFIASIPGKISGFGNAIFEAWTWPYRKAFEAIRGLYNNTIGGFSIRIPSWVPTVGGKGFDFPRMHNGGIVPGNPGNAVPIMAMAGERISRAGSSGGGGGGVTVIVQGNVLDGRQLADMVQAALLKKQRQTGNLGFEAA